VDHRLPRQRLAHGEEDCPAAERADRDARCRDPERAQFPDQYGVEQERAAPDRAKQSYPEPVTQRHIASLEKSRRLLSRWCPVDPFLAMGAINCRDGRVSERIPRRAPASPELSDTADALRPAPGLPVFRSYPPAIRARAPAG